MALTNKLRLSAGVLLGVIVAVLSAVLLVATPSLAAGVAGGQKKEFNITLRQWGFEPGIIQVNQGDTVVLHLHALDVTHGFYVDGYNVRVEVTPDEDQTITFVAGRAGRWTFRCSFTCGSFHPYMTGWLEVRPNQFGNYGGVAAAACGLGFLSFLGWEALKK